MDMQKHGNKSADLSDTRHGVAHALACLHLGITFSTIDVNAHGHGNVIDQAGSVDPETTARIAMAGPCLDLAVILVEDSDLGLDIVGGTVEGWRQDVEDDHPREGTDLIAAGGGIEQAAEWSLAFCWQNADLIDEATLMVTKSGVPMSYEPFAASFQTRTTEPDPAKLDEATYAFAGRNSELGRIDDLVLGR